MGFKSHASAYKNQLNLKFLFLRVVLPCLCIMGTALWMILHPTIDETAEIKVFTSCWLLIGFSLVLITVTLLDLVLDKLISWKRYPGLRFFLQMIVSTIFSIVSLNLSYYFIKEYYIATPVAENFIVLNFYAAALILPGFSLYFGYKFLKDWKRSELETERLQKENARSQMMSLKNHLDPHFLFNNLNILSSLMDKDINLSKEYLDKFAEVYRVILKAEYSDLTLLEEELQLIDAYIYLLKIRFAKSVFVHVNIEDTAKQKALPPLSIQMLIENAIKHNMANVNNPITIKIYSAGMDTVIVENNVQKKKYSQQERKGSGLENIKNRYKFFTDKPVVITEDESVFKVTLPLLEIDFS